MKAIILVFVLCGMWTLPCTAATPSDAAAASSIPVEDEKLMREAKAHSDAGRYAQAVPLLQQALLIRLPDSRRGYAAAVSAYRLAAALESLHRHDEAERSLRQALTLDEAVLGPHDLEVANDLVKLADILESLGRDVEALGALDRALEIRIAALGAAHAAIASTQMQRASQLVRMGRLSEALAAATRTLDIMESRFAPNSIEISDALDALASIYGLLGRHADALFLLERALAIQQLWTGSNSNATASAMNQLAVALDDAGRWNEAVAMQQCALEIYQKIGDNSSHNFGSTLNNLAYVYRELGRYTEALALFKRSLQVTEGLYGKSHPDVARGRRHLGTVYLALQQPEEARRELEDALAILALFGPTRPRLLAQVQGSTAEVYKALNQPDLAILYGKLSINTLQTIRGSLKELDMESRSGFLEKNAAIYQEVAAWLVEQGRIPEAHQILIMMKEQEYENYIRRDAAADPNSTKLPLTAGELGWLQRLTDTTTKMYAMAEESRLLQEKNDAGQTLSAAEVSRQAYLTEQIKKVRLVFQGIQREISQSSNFLAPSLAERGIMNETMDGVINDLGPNVALLHTIITPDQLHLTLVRAKKKSKAYTVDISQAALRARISELLLKLRRPTYDPRPEAAALYDVLIRPLENDLDGAEIKMLMVNLVGELRYIPMSVLYDGKKYLIEKYDLSLFNDAARDRVRDAPQEQWAVVGAGVSEAHKVGDKTFAALPSVPKELAGIVRDTDNPNGTLPGQRLLDKDFSVKTLQAALANKPAVLHIASHFDFNPGPEANSFLLLGDGTTLSVEAFRSRDFNLLTVDLLTLSACNTGTAGVSGGAEVEGMAVAAQKKGAKSVIATLWRVADRSTGLFMQRFYQLHQNNMNKARALRFAQLEMLRGEGAAAGSSDVIQEAPLALHDQEDTLYVSHPEKPYAHPFFWAPFVLMGNWR